MFPLHARVAVALFLAMSGAAQAAAVTDATLADKIKPHDVRVAAPTLLTFDSKTAGTAPVGDVEVAATPEPASIGLLLAGIGMIGVMSSRRRPR